MRAAGPYQFVTTTGIDSASCTASSPCRTINQAIANANSGDEIRIATGVYTDSTAITINKNIILQGGFTTTNWFGNPDPETYPTIIDGQDIRRGIYVSSAVSATLTGLHITNGVDNFTGAGIYNAYGTLTVENCRIYNNHVTTADFQGGGGISVGRSDTPAMLIIRHSNVSSNTAGANGGGISIISGNCRIWPAH